DAEEGAQTPPTRDVVVHGIRRRASSLAPTNLRRPASRTHIGRRASSLAPTNLRRPASRTHIGKREKKGASVSWTEVAVSLGSVSLSTEPISGSVSIAAQIAV